MEWVETTAKSVDEAKELALDQLGVGPDDAEFEVVESPRPGLFGRVRGEARVRARVRPTPVRPKQERRRGRRTESNAVDSTATPPPADAEPTERSSPASPSAAPPARRRRRAGAPTSAAATDRPTSEQGADMTSDDTGTRVERDDASGPDAADVERVRDAAVEFVTGLTRSFGFDATVEAQIEGSEIDVRVEGESLGLLIGPGGRTLLGIQDLARVAAQRRLGDHDTRLRVDVAGYREKRRVALRRFADAVAEQVRESGVARSLDAMPSADRKVLHDALAELDGVTSRSEGEEPNRRVVVTPT